MITRLPIVYSRGYNYKNYTNYGYSTYDQRGRYRGQSNGRRSLRQRGRGRSGGRRMLRPGLRSMTRKGEVSLKNSSGKINKFTAGKLKQFVTQCKEITNNPEITETVSIHTKSNVDNDHSSSPKIEIVQAGKLKQHRNEWLKITSDEEIIQTISGCTIEFEDSQIPAQHNPRKSIQFNSEEKKIVDNEIQDLLRKGVIKETCHEQGEFVSNIFLRRKKNGKYRMILNLKEFNKSVEYHHFKMDTFETSLRQITKGCVMASIDIKDAYCVPVHSEYRKYLKFEFNSTLFQFTCLPNGLSCAPRKYTKMMKPVYSHLRSQGHNICGYIDDNLLIADTEEELSEAINATTTLLESLGFTLNVEKSVLTPSMSIVYLGFIIDSRKMQVTLEQEKIEVIIDECKELYRKKEDTIRNVARVVGMIVATFSGVELGPLHYRTMEREKTEALKENQGNFDSLMHITPGMKQELLWWINHLPQQSREIERENAKLIITTDASSLGWGATLQDERTGGRWDEHEKEAHINYLELLAIFLALQSFKNEIKNTHVQILADNKTAIIAYVNHMGGKQGELDDLAKNIWTWCLERGMWISATHLPGTENVDADFESRHFNDRTEWSLNENIFTEIVQLFGRPDIDLFASRLNNKCKRYVSWHRDPHAEHVDAFSISWHDTYSYIFPPFSLLGRCVQKVRQEKAKAIMVVPVWPTQAWFTNLLKLLVQKTSVIAKNGKNSLVARLPRVTPASKTTTTDGCKGIRRTLREQCISRRATNIMLAAWKPGTHKQYNNYIQKWYKFCTKRKIDRLQPNVHEVLDFLTDLYDSGIS